MASIYEKKEPMQKAAAQRKARAAMVLYDVPSHRSDRTKYMKSGKKLSAETIKSLTEYFQSLFAQKKADGLLERTELDRISQRATRMLASSLREQRDARRSRHARGELRERERHGRGRSYRRIDNDGGDYRDGRDRCGKKIAYQHDGGDYRDGRDRRGEKIAYRRDRRDGRGKRGDRNNQPNGGRGASGGDRGYRRGGDDRRAGATKKAGEQRPFKRRDGKSGPNPRRNRAGSVPDDAHLIDGRYPSLSNRESGDERDTPLLSKGEDSSCSGNNEDHFAVVMAPPAKRGKTNSGGSAPRRARKIIAESDEDDDAEDNDVLLAEVDELLKGDDVDPLAFD
jgi:hypothetical protein